MPSIMHWIYLHCKNLKPKNCISRAKLIILKRKNIFPEFSVVGKEKVQSKKLLMVERNFWITKQLIRESS